MKIDLPVTVTLRDGRSVTIRRIRPGDALLLVDLYHHLSDRSKRLRFHAYAGSVPQERIWREAVALSDLDPLRQAAVVAVAQDEEAERIVGVARFARATPDDTRAEAAVVVRDDWQRLGLGTRLLMHLVPLAQALGITELYAWVMAENRHMIQLLQKAQLPMRAENQGGELLVTVSIADLQT